MAACRWRLIGRLDRDPGDLVSMVALALLAIAAAEPTPEVDNRHDTLRRMTRRLQANAADR